MRIKGRGGSEINIYIDNTRHLPEKGSKGYCESDYAHTGIRANCNCSVRRICVGVRVCVCPYLLMVSLSTRPHSLFIFWEKPSTCKKVLSQTMCAALRAHISASFPCFLQLSLSPYFPHVTLSTSPSHSLSLSLSISLAPHLQLYGFA